MKRITGVSALVLAAAAFLFSSCEQPAAGLGTKVDLTAPVIQVNGELGPSPGSYVDGEARIFINASDDSGIERVSVTYTYSLADENGSLIPQEPVTVPAGLDEETGLYYVDIDTTGMADGSLSVAINARDGSGKTTASDKLIYTVKNSPPLIELQIPRPQTENGALKPGAANHQVVINSFISGMFQDLAGVAPGYPQIRFWADSDGATLPPTSDTGNAGYSGVTASDGANDGWIPVDTGLVVSEQGERGNSFRYYLRNHHADGSYPGDEDETDQIPIGTYSLQIRAKDITGKEAVWPRDAWDGSRDRISLEIYAPDTLPYVELTADPDSLYQRDDFTVTARAEPRGDADTGITYLAIEVRGKKKGGTGTETGEIILAKWNGETFRPSLDFTVEAGKIYYRTAADEVASGPVDDENLVPSGAFYVTFGDGSYTFTGRTRSNTNAENTSTVSIYIDTQPPEVSVNSVTPHYNQDDPADTAAEDNPNNNHNDTYRRWTVNSTVKIQARSTDNQGDALDADGNLQFKYLLFKGNDIAENDFIAWQGGDSEKTFADYLYEYEGPDAALFDETKAVSTAPGSGGVYDGASYPAVNVSNAAGVYVLNLKTHEWGLPDNDYLVWLYIVSRDNAGNTNYDKILLNVKQETDDPTVKFTTINENGATFVDENYTFRVILTDDDGLNETEVEYRFSKDGGGSWSTPVTFPAFTIANGLSQDGLTIEIDSLSLGKIYEDLANSSYGSATVDDRKNILGEESAFKQIEIKVKDRLDKKVYTHQTSGDGVKTADVRSAQFKMDLNAPKIVPSTKDLDDGSLDGDPRGEANPFGAPAMEEGFGKTAPVFYGDIEELNPARLSFTINETTVDYLVDSIPAEKPNGTSTAVWGVAPGIRWRFDTSGAWPSSDGAHVFRLEVTDKAGRSAVKQVTFFKDGEGPEVNFITINGIALTDEEAEDIRDGGVWTIPETEGLYTAIKSGAVIKETDAKIIGTFVDGYSTVAGSFWYRIDDGPWISKTTGSTGKTANWEIPFNDDDVSHAGDLPDGFHTLDIRVKDAGENGYDNTSADAPNGPGAQTNIGFILDRKDPALVIVSPYGDKDTDDRVYAYKTAGLTTEGVITLKGLAGDSSLKTDKPILAAVDSNAATDTFISTRALNWRGSSALVPVDPAPVQWDAYYDTSLQQYRIHNGSTWDTLGTVQAGTVVYEPGAGEETILWTFSLSAAELNGEVSTDGTHKVTISAEDSTDRKVTKVWNFVRDNTEPVINIINGSPGNGEAAPVIIMDGTSPKIQGTVSDTHGNVFKLEALVEQKTAGSWPASPNWEEVTVTDGGWEKAVSSGDGLYRITVRASDDARVGDAVAGNTNSLAPLYFIIDSASPVLTVSSAASFQNNAFPLSGTVADENSVTISAALDGTDFGGTITPDGSGNWSVSVPIISTTPEGSHTVTITAKDQAGRTDVKMYNFTYDKTPPTAAIAAPGTGSRKGGDTLPTIGGRWEYYDSEVWINGLTDVRGTSSDTNGIAKISYYLGKLDGEDPGTGGDGESWYTSISETNNPADGWTDTGLHSTSPATGWSGGLYSWTFTENFNAYATNPGKIINDTSIGNTDTDTDYYLPLYVKVEDVAGNILVLHYNLWVDPDMDKPQVSIASPNPDAIVGGEVRITGTAKDDDWVYGVQIRVSYDDDDNETTPPVWYVPIGDSLAPAFPGYITDPAPGGWINASIVGSNDKTVAWFYVINSDGVLNPPDAGGTRQVTIEVRAIDSQDSSYANPMIVGQPRGITINFDAKVPTITNVKISRNGGSPEDFSTGVKAGGTFEITADIRDESGIAGIRARETGDGGYLDMLAFINPKPLGGNIVWDITKPGEVLQASWDKGYKYYIVEPGTISNWHEIDYDYDANKDYTAGTMFRYKNGSATADGSGGKAYRAEGPQAPDDTDHANYKAQYFEYKIKTTVDSTALFEYGKTGSYSLELQVTDNATPQPYMTLASYTVLVDNYFPTAKFTTQYNASTKNFYVSGTAQDYSSTSGSVQGLARVLVYFHRDGDYMNAKGETFTGITYDQGTEGGSQPAGTPAGISNFPDLSLTDTEASPGNAMVIDSQELGEDTNTDNDSTFAEQWQDDGAAKKWQARFDTTVAAMTDGPITVHYVIMDQAGNASHYTQDIYIRNNPPIIRQITLGTDLDGDGDIDTWEDQAPIVVAAVSGDTVSFDETAAIETNFTARNSRLNFNLLTFGGNGKRHYRVSHVTEGTAVNSTGLIAGNVYAIAVPGNTNWTRLGAPNNSAGTVFTATGPAAEFLDDGTTGVTGTAKPFNLVGTEKTAFNIPGDNGSVSYGDSDWGGITDSIEGDSTALLHSKLFIVKVYDSTVSSGTEADQLAHAVLLNMDIDNLDETPPVTKVDPFYWKSAADNSLYGNSKDNGHIELEADLDTSKFDGSDNILDLDPKVSGQISIRGSAYDNGSLKTLWVYLDDFDFTFTGGTTTTISGKIYTQAAEYANGTWTGTDQTTKGWKFTVNTDDHVHDQTGHSVSWRLDIDTGKISGVAAADRVFRILAQDFRDSTPNTAVEDTDQTGATRTNYYRMDVVPYISKIETTIRNEGGLKNNNIRSADGKYSVIQGSNSTFITVSGFNLNPVTTAGPATDVRIQTKAEADAYSGNTAGISLAFSGVKTDYIGFSASNSSGKSGYLAVYTNGIGTLNNINNNDSVGAFVKDTVGTNAVNGYNEENMPNREADRYTTKNITLTDDRYLQFFAVKDTGVKNGYYPTMIMDGDNPVFGYVNTAGGPSSDVTAGGPGLYRYQDAWPQRSTFNGSTGARTDTEYLIKGMAWDQMGMAKDEAGRYIHATVYNYSNAAMSVIYDRYAELYTDGMGWGAGTQYTLYPQTGNFSSMTLNNAITLETTSLTALQLDRYLYPKLIAKGNSASSFAAVYMAYYDDVAGNIIFRNFQIGTNAGGRNAALNSTGTASTGETFGQYTNLAENSAAPYVNNNGTPVVPGDDTWTSGFSNTTNYQYTTGRITAATGASQHFDMAVTGDNHVVVAYYDETEGQLKLRYSNIAVTGADPTTDPGWTTSSVDLSPYVGMYVSMVSGAGKSLHIAAFDAGDSDLKYIYVPDYTQSAYIEVTVDQYGSVGNWTQIKLKDNVPYIAYYNATETGGRDPIKLAWAKNAVTQASHVKAGVDANGYTTGNWEYMTVPAIDPPQGGSPRFQKVNLGFRSDTGNRPVLGYLGTNIEFSYPVAE